MIKSQSGGADAEAVGSLEAQKILSVDLDLGAGPFAEQDAVTGPHVERYDFAGFVAGAGTDGDDLALLRFFLGGVRDDDAALGLLLAVEAAQQHAIVQGSQGHRDRSSSVNRLWRTVVASGPTIVRCVRARSLSQSKRSFKRTIHRGRLGGRG